jgi:hypothetical protein
MLFLWRIRKKKERGVNAGIEISCPLYRIWALHPIQVIAMLHIPFYAVPLCSILCMIPSHTYLRTFFIYLNKARKTERNSYDEDCAEFGTCISYLWRKRMDPLPRFFFASSPTLHDFELSVV